MDEHVRSVVEACSRGSEDGTLKFPPQLSMLGEVGVEAYWADLRRAIRIYYMPNGESIEVKADEIGVSVAETFDAAAVESAVRQSQADAITYKEFCRKVAAAGCAAYVVSLLGRRVVYFGRTAETHVEHIPAE
jgi:uncharacterized protein YbcV (DUF1398 family)